jgi:serine/threonine-protein kinase HipA
MQNVKSAYVWIWLPNQSEPVVAGQLAQQNDGYAFVYGNSYRQRNRLSCKIFIIS